MMDIYYDANSLCAVRSNLKVYRELPCMIPLMSGGKITVKMMKSKDRYGEIEG